MAVAAAVAELAVFYRAVLGAAEAHQGIRLVDHLPIVLDADVALFPEIAVGVRESQPSEDKVSHWHVGRAAGIVFALDADQFAEPRRHDSFRFVRSWP